MVDGYHELMINVCTVFIKLAMTILRGIYMKARVSTDQLQSFVSASLKSMVATEAALPWNVDSPLNTAPQPKTPPTPRIRRARLSNKVKQKISDPSSPPKSRAQCLFQALAEARAQPKIAFTAHTAPRVTYLLATRRVAFSSWVEVQEYHPGAAPKRIQADRHRAGLEYMLASGKTHRW
ncbi:hypothetical protein FRC03_004484 [Tulasnella sp. 419]|nr:hypothetical protein FRC03_004484 [Tulasnella sp. 419]